MLPYEMSNISVGYTQLYRLQKPTFLLSVWEMSYKGSRHIGYHSQYSISDGSRFILARLFVWLLVLQQIFNHWSLSMSGLTGDSTVGKDSFLFYFWRLRWSNDWTLYHPQSRNKELYDHHYSCYVFENVNHSWNFKCLIFEVIGC